MPSEKAFELEPGLLTLFRLSLILRLGYVTFILEDYFEQLASAKRLELFLLLYIGEVIGLLLYLSLPGLQKHLGRIYLPLAIATNLILPAIETGLLKSVPVLTPGDSIDFLLLSIWLMPLILTAWQYSMREVCIFCAATIVLPVVTDWTAGHPMLWDSGMHESIGRTLLFGLVGYFISHLIQQQRSQKLELRRANQKLAAHAATLEQLSVSRERNRLARELHDTLAHTLSSATVQLDSVLARCPDLPDEASTRLEDTLSTLRGGLDETRRALQSLRSAPLTELGLPLALKSLAEDWNTRHSFIVTTELPETVDNTNEEIEHAFYRVAQEAMENIYRHANARHINVCLKQNDGCLSLKVTDDGEGFDVEISEKDTTRMGLRGMRERADLIGAKFSVGSTPGKGSVINLLWKEQ